MSMTTVHRVSLGKITNDETPSIIMKKQNKERFPIDHTVERCKFNNFRIISIFKYKRTKAG